MYVFGFGFWYGSTVTSESIQTPWREFVRTELFIAFDSIPKGQSEHVNYYVCMKKI